MPLLWIGGSILAAIVVVLFVYRARLRGAASATTRSAASPGSPSAFVGTPTAASLSASAPTKRVPARHEGVLSPDEISSALQALAFDVECLPPPKPAAYEALAPRLAKALAADATELRHAPRRPMLLPQLLRAMRNDDVSRRELSKIIARDPALAGNLLKLANSPFYRVSDRPVESVDRAVAVLGTDGIRSLVTTALVQPVFDLSKQDFPRFPQVVWEHTYRAATAAEAHAAIVEDTDPFAAQLLGLTLGLGSIVVFRVALEQCEQHASRPDPSVIAALLDAHAAPVACRIAASWALSERIADALADQIGSAAEPAQMTSLGRSLRFGRLIGALAVLRLNERINDGIAMASMLASGASQFQFESIWGRLTGKRVVQSPPAARPHGSWRDIGRPEG